MLDAQRDGTEIPVFQAVGPRGARGSRKYAALGNYRVIANRRAHIQLEGNDYETNAYVFTLQPCVFPSGKGVVSDAEVNTVAEDAGNVAVVLSGEGRRVLRTHLTAERNPGNRDAVLRVKGCRCEACGFHFGEAFGPELDGFIEVHHTRPIGVGEYKPSIDDFAVLCPNCHRASHKGRVLNPRTVDELRELLRRRDAGGLPQ